MSEQLPSKCGICRLALRQGDNSQRIRVVNQDFTPEMLDAARLRELPGPGLYSACPDCFKALAPSVAVRLGKDQDSMSAHDYM